MKKALLVMSLLTLLCSASVDVMAFAVARASEIENTATTSRWIPIKGSTSLFDAKTVSHDKAANTVTYWVKNEKKGETKLTKCQADLSRKRWKQLYEIVDGPGDNHSEGIAKGANGSIAITPDGIGEEETNMACDVLNLPPVLGVRAHDWKLIKTMKDSVGIRKEYICTDYLLYDAEKQVAGISAKAVWEREYRYDAVIDLKNRMVYYLLEKPRMAAPDTVEEALYDATLEMIAEKNKKEAADTGMGSR